MAVAGIWSDFDYCDADTQITYDGVPFTVPEGYALYKNISMDEMMISGRIHNI